MPLFLWSCFIDLCLFFWGSFSSDHRAMPIKKPCEVVDAAVKSPAGLWNFRGIRDKSPNLLPPSLTPLLFLPCTLSPGEGISLWWEPGQFSLPHQKSFFPILQFLSPCVFLLLSASNLCLQKLGKADALLWKTPNSWGLLGADFSAGFTPATCSPLRLHMHICKSAVNSWKP